MGSVGADYICPACGAVGKGGYAPDGVDVPICTESPDGNDCLSKWLNGTWTDEQFKTIIKKRAADAKAKAEEAKAKADEAKAEAQKAKVNAEKAKCNGE